LTGNRISPLAQVMAIVDVFDALTTTRPYRPALSMARACEELQSEVRVGRFSAELVGAFVGLIRGTPVPFI